MRISDWSSDVCSSDLIGGGADEAIFVAMAGNPPAKRREHVEMIDRALFAKADIERDDIDTCGMHVGQLPEKFPLNAAPRHAGLIVPDENGADPVEGARPTTRSKFGGTHHWPSF